MFKSSECTLITLSGEKINFEGLVQPKLIFTNNASLPVEIGCIVERENKNNGLVERYVVEEPGYYDVQMPVPGGGPDIGDGHYQMKVRRESKVEPQSKNNAINFYGETNFNAEANIANVMNINYSYINDLQGIEDELKKEIVSILEETKKTKNESKLKKFIFEKILPLPLKVASDVITAIILANISKG